MLKKDIAYNIINHSHKNEANIGQYYYFSNDLKTFVAYKLLDIKPYEHCRPFINENGFDYAYVIKME